MPFSLYSAVIFTFWTSLFKAYPSGALVSTNSYSPVAKPVNLSLPFSSEVAVSTSPGVPFLGVNLNSAPCKGPSTLLPSSSCSSLFIFVTLPFSSVFITSLAVFFLSWRFPNKLASIPNVYW